MTLLAQNQTFTSRPPHVLVKTPPIQLQIAYQIGERTAAIASGSAVRQRWSAVDPIEQRLGVRLHKNNVGLSLSQTISNHFFASHNTYQVIIMATDGPSAAGFKIPGQDWTVPLWIDGQEVQTKNNFDLVSPGTGDPLYKASSASVGDCNAAVAAAEKAFPAWSKTKPGFRRDLFLKAADEFARRKDELWQFANEEVASTDMYFAFDFNDGKHDPSSDTDVLEYDNTARACVLTTSQLWSR